MMRPLQEDQGPEVHAIRNMLGRVDLWIKSMRLKRPDDYNIRRESTVNLFFEEKSIVEAFAAEFKKDVIDVWGPQSDHQLDTMLEDERVVVKTTVAQQALKLTCPKQSPERDAKTVFEHIQEPNFIHANFRRVLISTNWRNDPIEVYCKDSRRYTV